MVNSLLDRLDLSVSARPTAVPQVRHAVIAFAERHGIPHPAGVGLAVTEALTNVVLHAYPPGQIGEVRVTVSPGPEELVVVVRDWGSGMRPRPDSPGLGLGLPTMASMASGLEVEAAESCGTLVRMHFRRAACRAA